MIRAQVCDRQNHRRRSSTIAAAASSLAAAITCGLRSRLATTATWRSESDRQSNGKLHHPLRQRGENFAHSFSGRGALLTDFGERATTAGAIICARTRAKRRVVFTYCDTRSAHENRNPLSPPEQSRGPYRPDCLRRNRASRNWILNRTRLASLRKRGLATSGYPRNLLGGCSDGSNGRDFARQATSRVRQIDSAQAAAMTTIGNGFIAWLGPGSRAGQPAKRRRRAKDRQPPGLRPAPRLADRSTAN